jgi:predicted S18 family serine protease
METSGNLMKKTSIIALLLVFLTYEVYAVKVSMSVPAVVLLGEGELVKLEVELLPGNGNVFVSTSPLVGIQTQSSSRVAFEVATSIANVPINRYDVFISFSNVGGARSVDGPSGGAAMSLLMLSAMQNKKIRGDFSITGTIEENGEIGSVGEVAKKAKASADVGMKVFVIPKSYDITDKMILSTLSKRWNLSVIEAKDIDEAAKIAFSSEGENFSTNVYELPAREKVSVEKIKSECPNCHLEEFKSLGSMIINESYSILNELGSQNKTEFTAFINYIKGDLEDSDELIKQGYLYSGANDAFLARLNANFLRNSTITEEGLEDYLKFLEVCMDNVKKSKLNKNNFEWVAGGEERLAWAKNKLREVSEASNGSNDDEKVLLLFKEALFAENWCRVSGEMFRVGSGIDGEAVNESKLVGLADEKLSDLEFVEKNFDGGDLGDAAAHINPAKMQYENGDYVGFIVDADYVISAAKALNKSQNYVSGEVANEIENLTLSNSSMWAFVYGTHSKFLVGQGGNLEGAFRISIYAEDIDSDVLRIRNAFEGPGPEIKKNLPIVSKVEQASKDELILVLAFSLFVALVLNMAQLYANKKGKGRRT